MSRLPNRHASVAERDGTPPFYRTLFVSVDSYHHCYTPSKIHGGRVDISFLEYDRQTDLYICGAGPDKINGAIVPLLLGRALIFLSPWLIKFTNATSSITRTFLVTT